MRATAQNRDAARLMGIDVDRAISFAFGLGGALAGVGGFIYFTYFTQARFDLGFRLGLFAFTAAVLGGIGNIAGAALGGYVIGFIENFNSGLTWHAPGPNWTESLVFILLILILVFRPRASSANRSRRDHDERALRATASAPIALGVAALLVLYPVFYHHFLSNVATNWLPNTSTAFTIAAFTVMGLGLNFVVGYAGLLDLGYVAFFAAGAYVAGWLGSQQFAQVHACNVGGTAFHGTPGSTSTRGS